MHLIPIGSICLRIIVLVEAGPTEAGHLAFSTLLSRVIQAIPFLTGWRSAGQLGFAQPLHWHLSQQRQELNYQNSP